LSCYRVVVELLLTAPTTTTTTTTTTSYYDDDGDRNHFGPMGSSSRGPLHRVAVAVPRQPPRFAIQCCRSSCRGMTSYYDDDDNPMRTYGRIRAWLTWEQVVNRYGFHAELMVEGVKTCSFELDDGQSPTTFYHVIMALTPGFEPAQSRVQAKVAEWISNMSSSDSNISGKQNGCS